MKPNILFVDDEKNILITFEIIFRKYYNISLANSGEKAIELLTTSPNFDVIVSDYEMPKMNGIELMKEVKKISPNCIRIMLTGYADLEVVFSAVNDYNIFKFLIKPLETLTMKQHIDDAVEYSRLRMRQGDMNKIRMSFMSVVSQNYKNPLTAILTSTYLLDEYYKVQDKASFDASIAKVQGAVQDMSSVIENIITLSHLETHYQVKNEIHNVDACLSDIINDYKYYESNFHVFEYQNSYTNELNIDLYLLKTVIRNILDNAVKFSPPHSIVKLIAGYSSNGNFQVVISDQGSGVREDMKNTIFEPFVKSNDLLNHSATGLGLTITKKCIDLLGGVIRIESEQNIGTTVTCTIPDSK